MKTRVACVFTETVILPWKFPNLAPQLPDESLCQRSDIVNVPEPKALPWSLNTSRRDMSMVWFLGEVFMTAKTKWLNEIQCQEMFVFL